MATLLGVKVYADPSVLIILSHALVARRHGIPISRITLFLFGGMAHIKGEPRLPKAELLMAAAGPATSIAIGLGALALASALTPPGFETLLEVDPELALGSLGPLASLLLWLGPVNLVLGVFNLVPGFPLEGGRVFRAIVWWLSGDLRKATRWASISGQAFAWVLTAWGAMTVARGGLVQGLWLLLIGWFLNNAARAGYSQLVMRESLRAVPVARVMRTRLAAIPPDTSVNVLVRDELMATDQRAFPVVGPRGELQGLVTADDVRKVPPSRWPSTPVAEIMKPAPALTTLPDDATAEEAFEVLARQRVSQVPVLHGDRPVGLVRSRDIVKWISLHRAEGDEGLATAEP